MASTENPVEKNHAFPVLQFFGNPSKFAPDKTLTMKKIIAVLATVLLISGAISCKKSSDGGNSNTGTKTVVITLTLSPVPGSNQGSFSGAANAVLPGSQGLATWKVNGVLRANESTISFSAADFQSGVLKLETTAAVTSANLSIGGVTTSQYPFNVIVQPTINGKASDPLTIPVTSTMQRSFTY